MVGRCLLDRHSQRRWGSTTFCSGGVATLHHGLPPPRAWRTVQGQPLQGERGVAKGFGYTGRLVTRGVSGDRRSSARAWRLSGNQMALRTSWLGRSWRCAFDSAGCRSVRQRPDARFVTARVVHGQCGAPRLGLEEIGFSRSRRLTEREAGRREAALSALQPAHSSCGAWRGQRLRVLMELSQPVRGCDHCLFFFGLLLQIFFLQVFQVTQTERPSLLAGSSNVCRKSGASEKSPRPRGKSARVPIPEKLLARCAPHSGRSRCNSPGCPHHLLRLPLDRACPWERIPSPTLSSPP